MAVLLHVGVDGAICLVGGGVGIGALVLEPGLQAGERLPGFAVAGADVGRKMIVVELAATGQQRGHGGNAEAAADVAHQVNDAGGVAHFLLRHAGDGNRHDGNHQARQGHAPAAPAARKCPSSRR
ncbi:MAG TPA: hypothetical protein VJN48_08015 [Terriglobales bacterium]|nr:hypothetical protein [Terriglobales bacterium]